MIDDVGDSTVEAATSRLASAALVIGGFLVTMWLIEIVDTALLDDRLQGNGIRPRSTSGLDGILWSPFLHSDFSHLISNTVPFAVLSGLSLTRGLTRHLAASAMIIGIGGLLVWLFAIGQNENHIGASGWVFGLFGWLVAGAWFERRLGSIVSAGAAVLLYGGIMLTGFVPRDGISWEGHLFGFIAGVATARILTTRAGTGRSDRALEA